MLGVLFKNEGKKSKVIQISDRPEIFLGRNDFIIVESAREYEPREGFVAIPYVNLKNNEIYYEYEEVKAEPLPPTEIELLKQRLEGMESALVDLILGGM